MVHKNYQMKIALITGGLGFIGTNSMANLLKTKKIKKMCFIRQLQ